MRYTTVLSQGISILILTACKFGPGRLGLFAYMVFPAVDSEASIRVVAMIIASATLLQESMRP